MTSSFSAGIPSASGSLRWKDYQSFLLHTTAFMLKNNSVALLCPRVFGVALSIKKIAAVKNDAYIRLTTYDSHSLEISYLDEDKQD